MTNPLLDTWDTPFGLAPFGDIDDRHFAPAIEAAMAEDLAEVDAPAVAMGGLRLESFDVTLRFSEMGEGERARRLAAFDAWGSPGGRRVGAQS